MSRKYSYNYSAFVRNRTDILGQIAYSLYKEDKVEFIREYSRTHGGAEPTDEELAAFCETCASSNSMERYVVMAQNMLNTFVDAAFEDLKTKVEQESNNRHLQMIRQAIEPVIPPKPMPLHKAYMHGIAQSILGAFIFMLMLCGLLFLLKFSDTQYTFTFGGNGSATIETAAPPAASADTIH